jgi:hypothetical protein
MSISQPDLDRVRSAFMTSLHEHWKFYLIEGIVLVILGLAAVAVPVLGTLAVTIFLGWLFLILDKRSAWVLVGFGFRDPGDRRRPAVDRVSHTRRDLTHFLADRLFLR